MGPASATVPVEDLAVSVYRIPTDARAESDGTYTWDSTTLVLVEARAGGLVGTGYTYADTSTARLIVDVLARSVCGMDVMSTPTIWRTLVGAVRNLGRAGIAS